jgi:hypothetical protein
MLRRPWWLLVAALLLPGCGSPYFWSVTALRGQSDEQQSVDRARCRRQARAVQTREGSESRAWWGGPVATMGMDPAGYQGCLEARGYRVE